MHTNYKEIFKGISTASIATALFKRGFKNQFIQKVRPLHLSQKQMVGEAYTLRYIPAREDLNTIEVFKNPSHPQRVAVEECPEGAVLVIDSRKDARAASAGSILVTRLMKRGCAGIVTDGGFRDAQEISLLDFPSFHKRPSAPTNLTLHQAIGINEPIACGDVAVFPKDIIVGDYDGVIVIPRGIAKEIAEECKKMELFEAFVTEQVKNGASVIGLYPPTKESTIDMFEKWKQSIKES
ncbi:ribonuclease activity regulator RraA [Joostella sp. CR20]|uniref:ribonuclease activity regulator RraA n=1 Tax=Joostella sp. CR20 TaxID=2804312 RepID=UPI00313CB087